jgi:hypothetical protein
MKNERLPENSLRPGAPKQVQSNALEEPVAFSLVFA